LASFGTSTAILSSSTSSGSTPTRWGGMTFGSAAELASMGEMDITASAPASGSDAGDGAAEDEGSGSFGWAG
jgi:hypothetical protein